MSSGVCREARESPGGISAVSPFSDFDECLIARSFDRQPSERSIFARVRVTEDLSHPRTMAMSAESLHCVFCESE